MGTEVSRRFIGSYSAVVRCAWEQNGDTASFCMRIATQIPLYYLSSPGAAIALSANPLFDAAVTGVYRRGL
jgi:hypothetical protein